MNSEKSSKICAFCDSSNIDLIMDFGTMALAGGFLKKIILTKNHNLE